MDWMPQAVRDGIVVVLVISGPLVLAAAFIGLIIGVLQAATQVQEQTIGSALKIIGVFAIIIFAGFWMYQYLNQYTARTISTAFTFIPRQAQKAVPINAFGEKKFKDRFSEKMDEALPKKRLRVLAPEKLNIETPEGIAPIGSPLLTSPKIPQPPQNIKLVPPPIPKIPTQVVKPDLMLSEIKEPVIINPPREDIQQKQINLVPGNPVNKKVEGEVFAENNNDNPSWLE